jgi:chromate transporter
LRPAVTGLIVVAGWEVLQVSIITLDKFAVTKSLLDIFSFKALILAAVLYFLIAKFKKHPIYYIIGAAVCGIVFGM